MGALSPFLRSVRTPAYVGVAFWCPGCGSAHGVPIEGANAWQFNGDVETPTIKPSIKITRLKKGSDEHEAECHLNLTDGLIHYHADCLHTLAGQIVQMALWPESFHDGDSAPTG